jgi:ABC-type transport system involved in cytochrome c biogenesis permease subunit
MEFIAGITLFCISASYAVALAVEVVHLFWPRSVQRLIRAGFGAAGLLAHTLLLARILFLQPAPLSLAETSASMLFVAWILAVFYLYGSIHHRKQAWGVFTLPLVLGLVGLAALFYPEPPPSNPKATSESLGLVHGFLVLLAAVGVCVGFVASIMYLVQAHRLKSKALPGRGIKLLSLERLEEMNRRAIVWAFPLLTAGLLVGVVLMLHQADGYAEWSRGKIIGTIVLWLVFAILLYLRYAVHVRGRRMALLTMVAFALLLFTLASSHPFLTDGGR